MSAPAIRNSAGWLGLQFMVEAARRLPKAPSGFVRPDCGSYMREAARDSGYCIDAPEELPAGGCYGLDLGPCDFAPEQPQYLPTQLSIQRGAQE